jgi:hypothetical protein
MALELLLYLRKRTAAASPSAARPRCGPVHRVAPPRFVAMPAAHEWILYVLPRQCAVGTHHDLPDQQPAPTDPPLQDHASASIGTQDSRHRTGLAQAWAPRRRSGVLCDETALLDLASSVEVLIVEPAIRASRCDHVCPLASPDRRELCHSTVSVPRASASPAGCPSTANGRRGAPLASYRPIRIWYGPPRVPRGTSSP